MPTKIFTILGGDCPFGRECALDSPSCRQCLYFFRAGTATFFWCNHPIEQKPAEIARKAREIARKAPEIARKAPEIARKAPEIAQPKRKRGRPPGKATKKPVKRTKNKKR